MNADRSMKARLWVFAAIALFYFAIPNARPDFTRFNAHDSESYLALSYNLVHGHGYTRSLSPDHYVPHKTWPPGMPLLMAPAVAVSGERIDWLAVKATMILVGLLGICLAWMLVRRVTERADLADLAALLLALNPFYWDFSHQAMSEVPTIVWILFAALLADRHFARRSPALLASFGVGLACGLGMLLRGNLIGLALLPLTYMLGARAMKAAFRRRAMVSAMYLAGFVIPFLLLTLRNRGVHAEGLDGLDQVKMLLAVSPASDQLKTPLEIAQQIFQNLKTYGIYRLPELTLPAFWAGLLAWKYSGVLAIALCALFFWAWLPRRPTHDYFALDVAIWPALMLPLVYTAGGAERYWVPTCLLLTVLIVIRFGNRQSPAPPTRRRRALTAAAVVVLVVNLFAYTYRHEQQPYNSEGPWAQLAALFAKVQQAPLQTLGVLTPNMHAFQLMTAYPAPMAVLQFDARYDHMVARADGKGPQPPEGSIAVLSEAPWVLYRLPRVFTRSELVGERDYSWGIPMSP